MNMEQRKVRKMSTVKDVHQVLTKLIEKGYGDYELSQGYDCNYATVNVDAKHIVERDNEIAMCEEYGDLLDLKDDFEGWNEVKL